jgi:hypothetical protein
MPFRMRAIGLVLLVLFVLVPRGGRSEPLPSSLGPPPRPPAVVELDECDDDPELSGLDERCLPDEDAEEAEERRDRAEDADRERLLDDYRDLDPDERALFCDLEEHEGLCADSPGDDDLPAPFDWTD